MSDQAERSLANAGEYLIGQQSERGGWHSATYGQLKDGAAVTTLALYALAHVDLAHVPADLRQRHAVAIERGFAFLDAGLAKRGTIAAPDGSLDFPTYAAAQWLVAVERLGRDVAPQTRQQVVDYLTAAQVAEPRGFEQASPSYGGWDLLGRDDAQGITTGTNISIACHVLEALTSSTPDSRPPMPDAERHGRRSLQRGPDSRPPTAASLEAAIQRGKAWALRCQQPDGGFAFTCEPQSLNNKAAYRDKQLTQPRSYGTATCDGIRALVACRLEVTDEPLAKALAWLGKHPAIELVPGFEGLAPEAGWDRGLRFYYWASLSTVLPLLPPGDRRKRREALVKQLVPLQHEDGSWQNDSDRMRENDPLIATPLAIIALAHCLSAAS